MKPEHLPYKGYLESSSIYDLEERMQILKRIMEANQNLIDQRVREYAKIMRDSTKPLVGEFYYRQEPETGIKNYDRFTSLWHDGVQVGGMRGSFFFDGTCSYSGGLDPSIPFDKFVLTDQTKLGKVWSFDRDRAMGHNGIYYEVPFRVWRIKS